MSDPYPTMPGQESGHKQKSKFSLVGRLRKAMQRDPESLDDLQDILRGALEHKLIDNNVYTILISTLEVSDMTAVDIMIPRAHMNMLDVNEPFAAQLPQIVNVGHSRFPVFEESRENVIGLFMTKDALQIMSNPQLGLRDLIRPAVFIPETKRVDVLLQEFRINRNHIAIVIDEHGGITGLVTMEDVLEQIVGSIEDEFDASERTIFPDGLNTWRVMAATVLEDIEQLLDCQFPEGDYDTLGGWLAHELNHIPQRGDRHFLDNLQFDVLRADSRRALWVRIKRLTGVQPPIESV